MHTGDVATIDANGFVVISDRIKAVIIMPLLVCILVKQMNKI
jgi:long-subunit acyl-CoA synthetase (AMP-forming)